MIGPLSVCWLAWRIIMFTYSCQPVIHMPGEPPRPAPLYGECVE